MEVITIYLYAVRYEELRQVKAMHRFVRNHLLSWFPKLPSYQAFTNRINRLCSVFGHLAEAIIEDHLPMDADPTISMTDSFPVITCSHKRKPRVALELTAYTYNATKDMWYNGVKVHISAMHRRSTMPYPYAVLISSANESDLTVFKENDHHHRSTTCFNDKAYCDRPYAKALRSNQDVEMLTPVKAVKGQSEYVKKRDKAANDLVSRAVSSVRQPLESLNNWIHQHSGIQIAGKVRSTKGLLVHVFGRLAAAFASLIIDFNP